MALAITLLSGGVTYDIQAEEIKIVYDRSPTAAPLPASDPLIIDLGARLTNVYITAIINETSLGVLGSGNTDPGYAEMKTIIESGYTGTQTLTFPTSHSFSVRIKTVDLVKQASKEDRWVTNMVFVADPNP